MIKSQQHIEDNQAVDKKDRIILQYLSENARITNKEIAKKARITPEGVRQRILHLEKQGIIRGYITYINLTGTQQQPYQILAKLKITSLTHRPHIVSQLQQCACVNWVGIINGAYDLGVIFTCAQMDDFASNYARIRSIFEEHIERQDVSIHWKGVFYNRGYLTGKHTPGEEKYASQSVDTLSPLDRKLLHILATNARLPLLHISQKLNISPQTVARRIRELEKHHVITGYSIHFNPWAAGIAQYKLLLTLKNADEKLRGALRSYMDTIPNVLAYLETFASWHIEIDLEVAHEQQRDDIIAGFIRHFDNNILSYQILTIKDMPVYRFFT